MLLFLVVVLVLAVEDVFVWCYEELPLGAPPKLDALKQAFFIYCDYSFASTPMLEQFEVWSGFSCFSSERVCDFLVLDLAEIYFTFSLFLVIKSFLT
jgi:hypothetical protein